MLNGRLEIVNVHEVAGWAWRDTAPNDRVYLDIFVDDVRVTSLIADTYRLDLREAGIGDGKHSFIFRFEPPLSIDKRHVVRVCSIIDNREELTQSPAVIEPAQPRGGVEPLELLIFDTPDEAPAQPIASAAPRPEAVAAVIEGQVDIVSTRQIAGWALDPAAPYTPVSLLITNNGTLLGRVLANRFRKDLEEAGKGSGHCAFEYDLKTALSPFARHEIRVRWEINGADLYNSPSVVEATQVIDATTQEFLSGLLEQAKTAEDISASIDFMAAETAKLVRRWTELDGKRFERNDYRHFMSRWRRRLPDAEAAVAAHREPKQILRALVIDHYIPRLDRDAGSHAIVSHIQSLQRLGFEVVFAPALEMRNDSGEPSPLDAMGVTSCRLPFYASVEDVLAAQPGDFDVIYAHRVQNAAKYGELIRAYCPKARYIYSVADLHHIRFSRQAKVEDRPELELLSQRMKRAEFLAAAFCDAVITHSVFEAAELAKHIPPAKIHIIPWAIPVKPVEAPFEQRSGVAFIGGYGHQPNQDAAYRLITEIMPRVRQRDPTIKCLLVGSNMPDSLRQACVGGIEAVGHVEDLTEIFNRIRLTVAPLAFGAGVKGKVLESLAAGIPCVCTPIAAEGIDLPSLLKSFVADDADAIAASIYRLHSEADLNQAAQKTGLDFITQSFSANSVDALMDKAIGPNARGQRINAADGLKSGRV